MYLLKPTLIILLWNSTTGLRTSVEYNIVYSYYNYYFFYHYICFYYYSIVNTSSLSLFYIINNAILIIVDVYRVSGFKYSYGNNYSSHDDHPWGPKRDPLPVVVPVTLIYTLIFATGIVGNVSTCIVIARNKYMHTATNYYLFSLAVSDLLLLLSGLPQEIYQTWSRYDIQSVHFRISADRGGEMYQTRIIMGVINTAVSVMIIFYGRTTFQTYH